MKSKYFLYLFPILLLGFTSQTYSQNFKNELEIISDNDVYIAFMQDRYYTNGLFVNFRHAYNQEKLNPALVKKTLGITIAQKIYTPYYGQAPDPTLHDRPFTGYLYTGIVFNQFYKKEQMLSYGINVGATGKSSLAEETQRRFHQLLGIYKIAGWEYQLKGEFSVNLNAAYNKLLFRTESDKFDIIGTTSAALGNALTSVNAGAMLRFGKINPIHSSASFNSRISNDAKSESKSVKKEFFLFTKPELNFIGYDATIQGGLFLDDKGPITFGVKRFVYSQQVGLIFASKRWTANYTTIFKSREVKSRAKAYYYSSVGLAYQFNKS